MGLVLNIVVNGRGLTDFGFVGNPNADGVGLATRGFVWDGSFIWLQNNPSVTTGWTLGFNPSITTTWTPG